MESLIIFVHVIAAIAITGLVLIQQGKGADMGASFGSGASQTIFGSAGTGNVLTRSTSIMAVVFFITSMGLAIIARQQADLSIQDSGLIQNLDEITAAVPAAPTTPDNDLPVVGETAAAGDIPVLEAEATDLPALEGEGVEAVEDLPAAATGETE